MKLLVLDDSKLWADVCAGVFVTEGYQVTAITSGFSSLRIGGLIADADVVLADADLGRDEPSGLELLRWTAERHPRVGRVLLTGSPAFYAEASREQVAHIVLGKPRTPEELLTAVTEALSLARGDGT